MLRKARSAMPEGTVEIVPGSGVFWSAAAVVEVCSQLGMPEIPAQLWPELAEQGSRDFTAVVEQVPRNPRILFCKDQAGNPVTVRVRRNDRFIPRMEVPVRWTGEAREVAVLTRKLPRRKGVW